MARRTPTQVVHDAAAAALAAGKNISDPIQRAFAFEQAQQAMNALTAALITGRAEAIQEARKTRTMDELAAELGVTRARLYQVLKAAT